LCFNVVQKITEHMNCREFTDLKVKKQKQQKTLDVGEANV